jgi:hypothetical protein
MCRIPSNPKSDNRAEIDAAIVGQAVALLKTRNCFDETAFRQFLRDAGLVIVLPDEVTAKWLHRVAEGVASDFTRWMAGGLQ